MELKKFNTRKSPLFTLLLCISLLMVALTGCNDDDDDITPIPEPDSVAYVSLYHMSPDAPPLEIHVDNNRINFNAFDYTEHTGYLRFYTGERNLLFTPFNASNSLVETTVNLEDDMLYSVFVTGTADDLEALVTEDEIPDAADGNTLVRVVHVSPDAPAVDLSTTGDEPLFLNVAYRTAADFTEIPAGNTSFEITSAGGDEVLASVPNVNFLPGRVYTLVVRGYVDPPAGNTNSLSVQIVPNFFNF